MKELTRQDFKDWGRQGGLIGGSVKTKAKSEASRRNGLLGGRPKGSKNAKKEKINSKTKKG